MKSIQAEYEKSSHAISVKPGALPEEWPRVCRRFNDDVERIRDVEGIKEYTGLYACYDDAGTPFYYLVREDSSLYRMKRKTFLDNIGVTGASSPE